MADSMSTEMDLAEALALLDQDPPMQTSTQAAVPTEARGMPAGGVKYFVSSGLVLV